jgi:hypothetical protein
VNAYTYPTLESIAADKAAAAPPTDHYIAVKAEILNRRKAPTDRSRDADQYQSQSA